VPGVGQSHIAILTDGINRDWLIAQHDIPTARLIVAEQ